MIQERHQIKEKTFSVFLELVSKEFTNWKFKNMSSAKDGGIFHYHISPRDTQSRGVLEITHNSSKNNEIILKIADNRKTSWSLEALDLLKTYLTSKL